MLLEKDKFKPDIGKDNASAKITFRFIYSAAE